MLSIAAPAAALTSLPAIALARAAVNDDAPLLELDARVERERKAYLATRSAYDAGPAGEGDDPVWEAAYDARAAVLATILQMANITARTVKGLQVKATTFKWADNDRLGIAPLGVGYEALQLRLSIFEDILGMGAGAQGAT